MNQQEINKAIEYAKFEAFVDGVQTCIDLLRNRQEIIMRIGPVLALETFLAGYKSVRKELTDILEKSKG